jgi:hypothetical protein
LPRIVRFRRRYFVLTNGLSEYKEICLLVICSNCLSRRALETRPYQLLHHPHGNYRLQCAGDLSLVEQWNDDHGKPLLFGQFDAAPAQFTMSRLACDRVDLHQTHLAAH